MEEETALSTLLVLGTLCDAYSYQAPYRSSIAFQSMSIHEPLQLPLPSISSNSVFVNALGEVVTLTLLTWGIS